MTMDESIRTKYDIRSKEVRADLKKWETEWAATHNGSKPSREDIKQNAEIAQKYKDYNKIRDILAGRIPPPERKASQEKKRKLEQVPSETPQKRTRHAETPSKPSITADDALMSPAISRKLFSPAPVTSLGPTPQRDGRVLGLFDLLLEKELGTPSKGNVGDSKQRTPSKAQATPSKRRTISGDETPARLGRTPMSSSKRKMLDDFMTPLKKRDMNVLGGKTPSSVSKLQFDTPAFLRRHTLPSLDEAAEFDAPVSTLRLPRKPISRGLSEIVASLRKVEEDRLDDDLDALREMEEEETGAVISRPQTQSSQAVVQDSQKQPALLGGLDDEALYDSPVEEPALGPDGQPLRTWKKKGQKRTTRRVKMKPTLHKRPDQMGADRDGSDDEDEVLAAETQDAGHDAYAETDGSDSDLDEAVKPKATKTKPKKPKKPKEGTVKKAARKVNELAHANFQRLKLRNHGAKGGPGFNSKFRRRR